MTVDVDFSHTFENAIELAAQMERDAFRTYLAAIRTVRDAGAREILREAALDELEHRHQLEKALVEGEMREDGGLQKPVPVMNLDALVGRREVRPESDAREALAFAIHLEKEAVCFYRKMTEWLSGTPTHQLFERMLRDETRHLQSLEDLYEAHFLAEN